MTATVASQITIRGGSAPVGAEILGVDLSRDLDEASFPRFASPRTV